jgi:diguanylate cyclase (GGDEF)-like protein
MMRQLGRNIDITTALSDYLQLATNFLHHPRLIEAGFYENVVHETVHDKLTGLFNRPYFDEAYSRQVALAKRYRDDFAILFLDIDNFKDINDIYGHAAGDEALRRIGEIINREKRDSDIAARYGGEEFVLLLTHTDNVSGFIFAERLRLAIENHKVYYNDQHLKLTVSGGIASFPFNSPKPEQLLEMADNAVYLSKGAGKNRISHFKKEKRRYLRVKIHQPILAKELDFNNSETFAGTSKDICIGGILFENDSPLPLGALIKVKVPVSEGPPVLLIGTVVRVEAHENGQYDIGMTTSFKEMDKIANNEIGSMLRSENMA